LNYTQEIVNTQQLGTVIKIQTKEQAEELVSMVDVFLMEHADVTPDCVWVGEIRYIHKRKFLGMSFGSEERRKKGKLLGWRLEHIKGRAWVLEDGGFAVQVGRRGPDMSVPVGWLLSPEQNIHYVDRHGPIDASYCKSLIEALHRS